MFTGIIENTGRITQFERGFDCISLVIESGFSDLQIGESVSVNGTCLTVVETDKKGEALFFVSPETLNRTNLLAVRENSIVNLERALPATGRLSGHIVQGHIDGVGKLAHVTTSEKSRELQFDLPDSLLRYCVEKGSIAINGISLTINTIFGSRVSVTIIPHTWEQTNLSRLNPGDPVNVEVDVLAKYVERLCSVPPLNH